MGAKGKTMTYDQQCQKAWREWQEKGFGIPVEKTRKLFHDADAEIERLRTKLAIECDAGDGEVAKLQKENAQLSSMLAEAETEIECLNIARNRKPADPEPFEWYVDGYYNQHVWRVLKNDVVSFGQFHFGPSTVTARELRDAATSELRCCGDIIPITQAEAIAILSKRGQKWDVEII